MNYKDTLNLPSTDFPMKANLPNREPEIMGHWDNIKLYGLASIGNKPTFSGTNDVLEVFIFNFKLDIYGETIKVIFLEKIRDQIKFNTKEELIDQMKNDHNIALNILRTKNEL